jgi:hypothetical protein
MAASFLFESGENTFVFLRFGSLLGSNVNNEREWLSGFGVDDVLSTAGEPGEPNEGKVAILSGEGEPNEGK